MSHYPPAVAGVATFLTTLVAMVVARLITAPIAFGAGLGFLDGMTYAAMVTVLRTGEHIDLLSPYVYRVLPIVAVAESPLELKTSFLALNMAAFLASAVLLQVLARRYGAPIDTTVIAIGWWAVLPAGLRLSIYYPVLIDGIGFLFLVALLLCAVLRNPVAYSLILPLALLTRENLIVLIPFLFLSLVDRGWRNAFVVTTLAAIPGLIALAAVRVHPPIPPANDFSTLEDIARNWGWFVHNAAERAWRFAAAPPLTLGFLLFVPFFRLRDSLGFLRRHAAWLYYAVATLALQPIGGGDFDRFAFWLTPLLVVLTVQPTVGAAPVRLLLALTPLHLVSARFLWTAASDEESFRAYNVASMTLDLMFALLALQLLVVILALFVRRLLRGDAARLVRVRAAV